MVVVMALIHKATLNPTKLQLLTSWLPRQTWVTGEADLVQVGAYRFDDPAGVVGIETLLLQACDGLVFHVPFTYRGAPLVGAEEFLIGTTEHSVLGTRWVYDGAATRCGRPRSRPLCYRRHPGRGARQRAGAPSTTGRHRGGPGQRDPGDTRSGDGSGQLPRGGLDDGRTDRTVRPGRRARGWNRGSRPADAHRHLGPTRPGSVGRSTTDLADPALALRQRTPPSRGRTLMPRPERPIIPMKGSSCQSAVAPSRHHVMCGGLRRGHELRLEGR